MKIQPDVLKALNSVYDLRDVITASVCSPQEKAEICHYILADEKVLHTVTPHIGALSQFIELFSDKNTTAGMEENIFLALLASDQCLLTFFHDEYFFSGYLFHHVADHEQQAVCQFFRDNCKVDILEETDLVAPFISVIRTPQAGSSSLVRLSLLAALTPNNNRDNRSEEKSNTPTP